MILSLCSVGEHSGTFVKKEALLAPQEGQGSLPRMPVALPPLPLGASHPDCATQPQGPIPLISAAHLVVDQFPPPFTAQEEYSEVARNTEENKGNGEEMHKQLSPKPGGQAPALHPAKGTPKPLPHPTCCHAS